MTDIHDDLGDYVRDHKLGPQTIGARALRRIKRDRAQIRKLEGLLKWYDDKVTELKAQIKEGNG